MLNKKKVGVNAGFASPNFAVKQNLGGFTAMHVVIAVGVISVTALIFFGLPSGIKDFFADLRGDGAGTASISSFGVFETSSDGSADIDSVANTIVNDLIAVQAMAKAEPGAARDGICFKNPEAEADFYIVASNVSFDDACDSRSSIVNVAALPVGTIFVDPDAGQSLSVVFKKDGTSAAASDTVIRISSSTGTRIVTVTPAGNVTYSVASDTETEEPEGESNPSSGSNRSSTGTRTSTGAGTRTTASAGARTSTTRGTANTPANVAANSRTAELNNIAAGLANVLSQMQALQSVTTTTTTTVTSSSPSAPLNLNGQGYNGYTMLSWTAPSFAGTSGTTASSISTYKVYRGTVSGQFTATATIGQINFYTDYTVTNGVGYYYRVTAVNSAGFESPFSNEVYVIPSAQNSNSSVIAQPSAPLNIVLNGNPNANQINVTWTAPSFTGNSAITGYRIYRSVSGGGLVLIYDSSNPNNTSFIDSGLAVNNTYCYIIVARNAQFEGTQSTQQCIYVTGSGSNGGGSSNIIYYYTSTGSNNYYVSAPNNNSNVYTSQLNTGASNTYTSYPNTSTGYTVYPSAQNNQSNTYTSQPNTQSPNTYSSQSSPSGSSNVYTSQPNTSSTGASNTNNYTPGSSTVYTSAANNSYTSGTSSATYTSYQNSGSYTSQPNSSTYTSGGGTSTANLPGAPGNLSATAHPNNTVSLSWDFAPGNGSSISGYKVYRGTSSGNTNELVASITGCVCANGLTAPLIGQTYYFTVTAINAGGEGPKSNEVAVANNSYSSGTAGNTYTSAPASNTYSSGSGYTVYSSNSNSSSGGYTVYSSGASLSGYTSASASNGYTAYPNSNTYTSGGN